MATVTENLTTARAQMAANLVTITANPKPSYTVDQKQYSWGEYLKILTEGIAAIDLLMSEEEGPSETVIQGYAGW